MITEPKLVHVGPGEWRLFEGTATVARVFLSRGEYRPQVTVGEQQLYKQFSSLESAVAWAKSKRRGQNGK